MAFTLPVPSEVKGDDVGGGDSVDDSCPFAAVTSKSMEKKNWIVTRSVEPLSREAHVAVDDLDPLRVGHNKG